ncbi:alpha/beta fold hydrolase [Nesterenkonia marinintestina]|uniref:alpha/beta fold hydrolase n=1 Tax=Nesterenkonia marinintestina TaxID=2979865 RepID=UPI0021C03092|nr:alpha/beta hydrolase [Nesterenkonia sp. GX14115]
MYQADGAQLHCRSAGEGPAVVQLHGLTSHALRERAAGLDMTQELHGVRTLHIDARAHGSSTGRPVPEDYVWPQLAADLLGLLDVVAPGERVAAAGPSMGAATLLYAALEDPDRFTSLTLLVPPTAWETRAAQAKDYRRAARMVEALGVAAFARLGRLMPPPPAQADRTKETMPSVSRELLPSVFRGAALTDLPDPERLRRLDVPCQLLAWTEDAAHPLSTAEELHRLLPDSTLDVAETPEQLRSWPRRTAEFMARRGAGDRTGPTGRRS